MSPQPTAGLPLILLLVPLIALLLGIYLLRTGWWPRRRGDTPVCSSCGYLLIANQSGRCPECGQDLAQPRPVVLGLRTRRPTRAITGALLILLLGILPIALIATGVLEHIEWYHYRPAAWVLKDMQSSNAGDQLRAFNELERRRAAGQLSPDIEQKLIEVALADQALSTPIAIDQQLVDFLGDMLLNGKLTQAQADLFFQQSMTFDLKVRPQVRVGDNLAFLVSHAGHGPSGVAGAQWWFRISPVQISYGGKTIQYDPGSYGYSNTSGSGGGSSLDGSSKVEAPGKQILQTITRVEMYHGPFGQIAVSKLFAQRDVIQTAPFEALLTLPDDLKLIDDPSFTPQIQKALTPQIERYTSGKFNITINVNNAPTNVAFNAFARFNGQEYPIGALALAKNRQTTFVLDDSHLPKNTEIPGGGIDIILRSSEPAARRSVDLFEIWKGEIEFPGVGVNGKK